jgi:twitching motility two-component system response regulator PilH
VANILIVEDSPSQALALQRLLEKHGHVSYLATDGEQCLEMAKEKMPDLVLMDIIMPNLNGFQATRKLAKDEKTKHIPVVILTTKDMETDRIWGLRQGAQAYITKPFKEDELAGVIKNLLPA